MKKQKTVLKFKLTPKSFEITGTTAKPFIISKPCIALMNTLLDEYRHRKQFDYVECSCMIDGFELVKSFEFLDWCHIYKERLMKFPNGHSPVVRNKDIFIRIGAQIH